MFSFQLLHLVPQIFTGSFAAASNGNHSMSDAAGCDYPTQWFTQATDHANIDAGTFEQKYYITTEFYKPGGPILLFQGEESTSLDCVDDTVMFDFARELNGIAVALEHRYFGDSVPFGSNLSEYTPDQWKYLTLDNVMDDAVSFVQDIKQNFTGAASSPVFVASGSYGGFLMVMFRQNRPEAFDGVIASAPPLRSFFGRNDTNVPDQYNWWNYISRAIRDESFEAAEKIQNAFSVLVRRFQNNQTSRLKSELGLCESIIDNSAATLALLTLLLRQVYSNAVELNYNVARPGRSPIALPLNHMIEIALNESDPMQILRRSNFDWYTAAASFANETFPCFNLSNAEQIIGLSASLISRVPFSYITCSYLSFEAYSVPANSDNIFPPTGPPAEVHGLSTESCKSKYKISALPAASFYSDYNITTLQLQNSTRIVFSLAQYDPTTSISGYSSFAIPVDGGRDASRWLFTSGMAHREDLFAWFEGMKENVKKTNEMEIQILKGWMRS